MIIHKSITLFFELTVTHVILLEYNRVFLEIQSSFSFFIQAKTFSILVAVEFFRCNEVLRQGLITVHKLNTFIKMWFVSSNIPNFSIYVGYILLFHNLSWITNKTND